MIILKEDEVVKVTTYCSTCKKYYDVTIGQEDVANIIKLKHKFLCPNGHELDTDPIINAIDFTLDEISEMHEIFEDMDGKYFIKDNVKYRIYG